MTKDKNLSNLLQLNLAIVFMATSGVLARYINLPVPFLIGFRAIVASVIIFLFCKWKGFDLTIKKKDRGLFLLSGVLMGIHWITYFTALRLSNVAVGMISLFTFPVITSFLEPLILKKPFQKIQIVLGVVVLLGVYFLVPEIDFQNDYFIAILVGVFSAIIYSLRNIVTKSRVSEYNGSVMMMYQLIVVGVLLTPTYFFYTDIDVIGELPAALTLALLTTAIGHTMFLYGLKNFSATSASIIASSQPVYGILLAMLFLNEFPEINSVIGGLIILSSVLIENMGAMRNNFIKQLFNNKE